MLPEPVVEGDGFQFRVGAVAAAGGGHCGQGLAAFPAAEVGIAEEGGQQIEGQGQRAGAEAGGFAGAVNYRHIKAGLQVPFIRDAETGKELAKGMAAADDDVLAVVNGLTGGGVGEGKGAAAEEGAGFDQGYGMAGGAQVEGGGDAGDAAAEDDDARGGHQGRGGRPGKALLNQARAIMLNLAAVERLTRWRSTS